MKASALNCNAGTKLCFGAIVHADAQPPGNEVSEMMNLAAFEDEPWWGNQKPGTQVESLAWMDAGWMVDIVNLHEKWVRFVRQ